MHKIAKRFNPIRLLFKYRHFDAVTLPFLKVVYYRDEFVLADKKLVKHENVHLEQIERDGSILFSIKYTYYSLRYGWHNPYEVEARAKEKGTEDETQGQNIPLGSRTSDYIIDRSV